MLCGLAVIALMEVTIAKKKEKEEGHKFLDYNRANYYNNGYWHHLAMGPIN